MKVLIFIAIIYVLYYLLKAFFRLVRIIFMAKSVSYNPNQKQNFRNNNEIRIEGQPRRIKLKFKDKAEYVDYEEID